MSRNIDALVAAVRAARAWPAPTGCHWDWRHADGAEITAYALYDRWERIAAYVVRQGDGTWIATRGQRPGSAVITAGGNLANTVTIVNLMLEAP